MNAGAVVSVFTDGWLRLMRQPIATLTAVMVVAVGLTISIFVFSFVNSVYFRPLPFEKGDQIVAIAPIVNGSTIGGGRLTLYDAETIRRQTHSFAYLGAYSGSDLTFDDGEHATIERAVAVERGFLESTGIRPLKGRIFRNADFATGATPVIVIGYDFWQHNFGGNDAVIGQRVKINNQLTEIVGIMPPEFYFPYSHQLWVPLQLDAALANIEAAPRVEVFARLKDDVSSATATAELQHVMQNLRRDYPARYSDMSLLALPFQRTVLGDDLPGIVMALLIAMIAVLLLSCVNVGNLLLVRANERRRETAIRLALGAPLQRLLLDMLAEGLGIGLLGWVIGITLAALAIMATDQFLPQIFSGRPPFWWHLTVTSGLVWQSLLLMLCVVTLTAFVPALKIVRGDINVALRSGTRGAVGRSEGKFNRVVVVIEVALSCALLVSAGFLVAGVNEAINFDYGVRKESTLTAQVVLPENAYTDSQQQVQFFRELRQNLAQLPGVRAVATTTTLPGAYAPFQRFEVEGQELNGHQYPRAGAIAVASEFFTTVDATLLEGRLIDLRDNAENQRVAVITQGLAQRQWPGQSALGKRLRWVSQEGRAEQGDWITVVGVVSHIVHSWATADDRGRPSIYQPEAQVPARTQHVILSVAGDPQSYTSALKTAIRTQDPHVPIVQIKTLDEIIHTGSAAPRLLKNVFLYFAIAAIILAITGIYSVIARSVDRRTQEIGIRRALGADERSIVLLLMRQSWQDTAVGLLLGAPVAYGLCLVFNAFLAPPPWQAQLLFISVPLAIVTVITGATYIPTQRSVSIEPAQALRSE